MSASIMSGKGSNELMNCRPERWENVPEGTASIPGVWSHLLTFIGGPRACIGYRFTLIECVASLASAQNRLLTACRMKALIFTLVRAFEFELAFDVADMQVKSGIVMQPRIVKGPEAAPKSQMPLIVKPYRPL